MTQHTQTLGSLSVAAADPRSTALIRAFDALFTWIERAQARRSLASMSDGQLKDVGLSRADIGREVDKPFWRH
jgi:uncharacterized protein YjiS (DUF1127 family)